MPSPEHIAEATRRLIARAGVQAVLRLRSQNQGMRAIVLPMYSKLELHGRNDAFSK